VGWLTKAFVPDTEPTYQSITDLVCVFGCKYLSKQLIEPSLWSSQNTFFSAFMIQPLEVL